MILRAGVSTIYGFAHIAPSTEKETAPVCLAPHFTSQYTATKEETAPNEKVTLL